MYDGRGFSNWGIALPMLRRQVSVAGGIHRGLSNTVALRQKGAAGTFGEAGKANIASSVKGLERGDRFLEIALGHAGAVGEKLGGAVSRSLEAQSRLHGVQTSYYCSGSRLGGGLRCEVDSICRSVH